MKRSGRLHLLAFILAPVLVSYFVWQPMSSEPDFKEKFTAITALLFGFYHFLRSLVGVIQLIWFQDWAKRIATVMERGGYWQELQPENQRQTRKQKKQSKAKERNNASLYHIIKTHGFRDSIQRNWIWRGLITALLTTNWQIASVRTWHMFWNRKLFTLLFFGQNFWSRVARIFAGKRRDFVEAKLTTFVRWAVAFLPQFGNNWLMDVADTALVQSELRRTNKRREFAVKVLAAATLRLGQTEVPLEEFYKPDLGLNLVAQKSYLPLGAWRRITKQKEDIVLSREEFARASLQTSFHMPGNVPVLIEEHANGGVHGKRKTHHYRHLFDPLIAEVRSALHPTLREYLQRHGTFSSQQLEWFGAFLCTQCVLDDNQMNTDNSSFQEQATQDSNAKKESSVRNGRERENENDTAVWLLRSQLGLEDYDASKTFFYPFLKGIPMSFLGKQSKFLKLRQN